MHDTLLLFGATGDLAQRYLFASLVGLYCDRRLQDDFRVVAIALSPHDTEAFRTLLRPRLRQANVQPSEAAVDAFLARVEYRSVDLRDPAAVAAALQDLTTRRCLSYLAIPPGLYLSTSQGLSEAGLLDAPHRLVLEKPIGHNLASACDIDRHLSAWIDEARVFRLDHYLGKAPVQNLLALRFGNTLLEAVWNRHYVASVDILVAESEGLDGRDAYYARSGALRDMVQSHILQLLCLVAMEPPASLQADRIRDEKVKVLRALRPLRAHDAAERSVRGRYTAGVVNGTAVQGYQAPPDSDTETFAAVVAYIDNTRWAGVPFRLCTGKRLAERSTRIVVTLQPVAHWLFERPDRRHAAPNRLIFRLQPQEDIELGLMSSLAAPEWGALELRPIELDLSAQTGHQRRIAYERLLLDALQGNSALFVRNDEVEAAWAWTDSVLDAWREAELPVLAYPAGSWGPAEAAGFLPADYDEAPRPQPAQETPA